MIHYPKLYAPENLERSRYAQIAALVVAVGVCGYMASKTLTEVRDVHRAQQNLSAEMQDARKLSRQSAIEEKREAALPPPSDGGLDIVAVQFSRWARELGVRIGSFTPEGTPTASEIKFGDVKLGNWNSYRVRVAGSGPFPNLMDLLDRFRDPGYPIRLESFSITSSGDGGEVTFNLVVTVYEKKSGAG